MNNGFNPMELARAMQNPQAFITNALIKNPNLANNPMIKDAMNNPNEAEKIARNLAKNYGVDLSMFGIK